MLWTVLAVATAVGWLAVGFVRITETATDWGNKKTD